jgi:hypothetical protein
VAFNREQETMKQKGKEIHTNSEIKREKKDDRRGKEETKLKW